MASRALWLDDTVYSNLCTVACSKQTKQDNHFIKWSTVPLGYVNKIAKKATKKMLFLYLSFPCSLHGCMYVCVCGVGMYHESWFLDSAEHNESTAQDSAESETEYRILLRSSASPL